MSYIIEFISGTHLFLFALGILLHSYKRNIGIELLGYFFLILGIHFLIIGSIHLFELSPLNWNPFLTKFMNELAYIFLLSYGPLLFLINKYYLSDEQSFPLRDFIHFISLPLMLIISFIIGSAFDSWPGRYWSIRSILVVPINIIYCFYSISYLMKMKHVNDYALKKKMLAFLDICYTTMIIIWSMNLTYKGLVDETGIVFRLLFMFIVIILVDGLVYMYFKEPDKFLKSKYLREIVRPWQGDKYVYSEINNSYSDKIIKSIDNFLFTKGMYKGEVNLKSISEATGFPEKDISQVLNIRIGQSFREYVNNYRIVQAKDILDNNDGDLRINELMVEVGFNSKSIFHKYFKDKYGTTPKQYLSQKNGTVLD